MKLTNSILIVLLTGAAVLAQGPPPHGGGFGRPMAGGPGGGFGPRGHKLVTGAPYSADMNLTRTQTLPDGNVIQHTTTGKVARDAEGRTYSMETSTGGPLGQTGPVTRISIFDPVAGYSYELNPATKTAAATHLQATGQFGTICMSTRPINDRKQTTSVQSQNTMREWPGRCNVGVAWRRGSRSVTN